MGQIGWTILLICLLSAGTLFFSVNTIALRIFSLGKLQEAFKEANRTKEPEGLTSGLVRSVERLVLACSVYRVVFNLCIFLLVLVCFSAARPAGSHGARSPSGRLSPSLLVWLLGCVLFQQRT